jgi:LmbE family N-acetylglucosaminyl deacetylase
MASPAGELADLTGRTVLAVFAHPDDESLACGGTLARLSDAGAHVIILCATRGERGFISDPALVAGSDLGSVRTDELKAAARVLGVREVIVCDHPDGSVRWADVPEFHAEIMTTIAQYRPDGVITFDEDGLYWHLDHVGVHERTCTAVRSLGVDAPALYFVTMPRGAMRHVVDSARAKGWVPPQSGFWSIVPDAFGIEAEPPTLNVDIGAWVPRKLAALRCHRTQIGSKSPFSLVNEADARRWLGVECFRRADLDGAAPPLLERFGDPVVMT